MYLRFIKCVELHRVKKYFEVFLGQKRTSFLIARSSSKPQIRDEIMVLTRFLPRSWKRQERIADRYAVITAATTFVLEESCCNIYCCG